MPSIRDPVSKFRHQVVDSRHNELLTPLCRPITTTRFTEGAHTIGVLRFG